MLTNELKVIFHDYLNYLEKDIKNCPDELWEKKFGGDFIWQQMFHVIAGTAGMMYENMEMPKFPIPSEVTFLKQVPDMPEPVDYNGPHGKDIMLESLKITRAHINDYFNKLDDRDLFVDTDFLGLKLSLYRKIEIIASHIMYHVGAMDCALREHGAETAM